MCVCVLLQHLVVTLEEEVSIDLLRTEHLLILTQTHGIQHLQYLGRERGRERERGEGIYNWYLIIVQVQVHTRVS